MRIAYLLALTLAVLLGAWLFVLRPAFLGGPAGYVMVSGKSMEPTFYTGDLVVTQEQPAYGVGDVVAFRVPEGEPGEGGIVIHRIVGGDGETGFVVRGDNKNGPDPWHPRQGDIVGKQWLYVPRAGRVLAYYREPRNFGLLVGGLTAVALIGEGAQRRRRRGVLSWRIFSRHGKLSTDHHRTPQQETMSETAGGTVHGDGAAPRWLLVLLGLAALLTLALIGAALYAFRQPLQGSQTVERLRYEHTVAFDYAVHVQPSALYPSGVVGPVGPEAPSTGSRPGESPLQGGPAASATGRAEVSGPIPTRLARSLDLKVAYGLKVGAIHELPLKPSVSGEYGAALEIKAGQAWSKRLEILPPTAFAGPNVAFRVPVDLAQIQSLIETIEKETGLNPGTYDLVIAPTVQIAGSIAGEPVEESYSPPFTLKWSRTQITPDAQLTRSETKTRSDTVTREETLGLFGWSLAAGTARVVSAGGAAVALALSGLLAAVVFLGLGRDEVAKIRARHGSLLVGVAEAEFRDEVPRIQVASIRDLVRLAQRDGRSILHQEPAPGAHRYFLYDGAAIYEYTLSLGVGRAEPARVGPHPDPLPGGAGMGTGPVEEGAAPRTEPSPQRPVLGHAEGA